MNTHNYTDLSGEKVTVEPMDWLEDGRYWDEEEETYLPCARYCIGDDDGDGISVWLNDDGVEVEA